MNSAPATARPSTVVRQVVNRWLSPDHPIGQSLLALRMRAQLAVWRPQNDAERRLKVVVTRIAPEFTMVALPRLRHLASLAGLIAREHVPGAVVECGTWRGGTLALIAWVLRDAGDERTIWGFDSFAGLPRPGPLDDPGVHEMFFPGWCAATPDDVRRAVRAVGAESSRLEVRRGWLSETLPQARTGPIALLNLDVDWYDSTKAALDALFDLVVPSGVINIDDFGRWQGCDAAVRDFFAERGLPLTALQLTGPQGAWFRKP